MLVLAQVDTRPLQDVLSDVVRFIPALLAFLAILAVGWFAAKAVEKVLDRGLERVGFDRWVERGGIRRAMARTRYDASDLVSKLVFYTLVLLVLQLAFGVFGPNPVSDLLFGVIAFLPKLIAAIIIVVVAAAIATAVREIVTASLGGLPYGGVLATVASAAILVIGVFAALNQIEIAPAIVNGLFYALLAIIAGSAIVAIGGGGIVPMRRQWEKALDRLEREAPRVREEARRTSWADVDAQAQAHARGGEVRHRSRPQDATIQLPEEQDAGRRP